MLTSLDETLYHQAPISFEQAAVTDHRFYDRYSDSTFAPDGSAGLLTGRAVYKNMNVMDGLVSTQLDAARQCNIRLSRPLRPIVEPLTLGPMRTGFPEAFRLNRFICEPNEHGDAFDLTFRPFFTRPESPHHGEADGRVHTYYRRFSQIGWTSGTLEVDGTEHTLDRWFGWRDHPWGVRSGVGGSEANTGTRARGGVPSTMRAGGLGILLVYVGFATASYGGFVQLIEDENGKQIDIDGSTGTNDGEVFEVVSAKHAISFIDGTRLYDTMDLQITTADGQQWGLAVSAVGRACVDKGTGYDHGWNDEKGLGAWRGDSLTVGVDEYDVSDFEAAVLPDGRTLRPIHREQPVRVRGAARLPGSVPIELAFGPLRRRTERLDGLPAVVYGECGPQNALVADGGTLTGVGGAPPPARVLVRGPAGWSLRRLGATRAVLPRSAGIRRDRHRFERGRPR